MQKPIPLIQLPVLTAIVGMLITITGVMLKVPQYQSICFASGGCFLLFSSYLSRQWLYFTLQIVVIIGALSNLFTLPFMVKAALPVALAMIILIYFYFKEMLKNATNFIGAIGVMILACGYAILHPMIYFVGGVVLSIYSGLNVLQGVKVAWIWLILNVVFSVLAGIEIFHF